MTHLASFLLIILSITLYALAGGICLYATLRKKDHAIAPAKGVFLAAMLAQSASIGITSVSTSGTLVTGPNILMLASWVLAVITLIAAIVGKRMHGLLALSGPAAAILMAISQVLSLLSPNISLSNSVYHEWPLLVVHIMFIFLGASCFVISAAASCMQLYQQNLMRKKSRQLLSVRMPAINTVSNTAKRTALAGTVLFTLGLLIGLARLIALHALMVAIGCAGNLTYLVPRVTLSIVVWLVYVSYLVFSYLLPHVIGSKARAFVSVAGLVLAIALIVVSAE